MPIYEYACASCGGRFEKLVRSTATTGEGPDVARCPSCGAENARRALSVFAVNASAGSATRPAAGDSPMCGRCGGPGPCANGF